MLTPHRGLLTTEVDVRFGTTGLVLLALVISACGEDLPPGLGDPIPDVEFEVIDPAGSDWEVGQRIRLREFGRTPVVLDFWASWCVPCRDQHAFVSDLVARYGSRIQAVGILYEDTPANAREWLGTHGATYPTVREVDAELESVFWIRGIPRFVLLDPDRRLSWDMMGGWGKDSVIVRLDAMLGIE